MVRPQVLRWLLCSAWLAGCNADPILSEGEFGRPIPVASGDVSPLVRLAFIDEGCPGAEAVGGCGATGNRTCEFLLIDTLAPLTTLEHRNAATETATFGRECLEVRSAVGLAAETVTPEDLQSAVARFRFDDLPLVRAPVDGGAAWSWRAGTEDAPIEPSGVLGGNLLREFAISIRRRRAAETASIAFFSEFPGTERDLANQGLAFLPLQFPGRLLGREVNDRCDIGDDSCDVEGFDLQGRGNIALQPTRMVLDACVAVPPCGIAYAINPADPFAVGVCRETAGVDTELGCVGADDAAQGGRPASMVVASGVSGMVLFEDSAVRMLGPLDQLPTCDAVTASDLACREPVGGTLFVSGWPPAGDPVVGDALLPRLRVRSIALLPGLTRPRGEGACTRAQDRLDALERQCINFTRAFAEQGNIEDTRPPYADDEAGTSLAVLGEAVLAPGTIAPDPTRWIETLILSPVHPLPLSVRRDVTPDAVQPDGLLGTALFDDTGAIFDYTDPNPGVRLSCLDPRTGDCLVAPECHDDAQAACCFGLPLNLLVEFIVLGDDDTCCAALSAEELDEIKQIGACEATSPP
jgi:hypothetical protein